MQTIKKYLLLPIFTILWVCSAYGQFKPLNQSIYFETAGNKLSVEAKTILNRLIDSINQFETYEISIQGNADNVGENQYNQKLSEQRISSTEAYLISKGIPKSFITSVAFGEERPIADNLTDNGKQLNRRVDISISYLRKNITVNKLPVSLIWELYKQLEIKPQEFNIDPKKDTLLRCKKGTVVFVKANTFAIPEACSGKYMTLKVKEDFLKSEMILDNITTVSNGNIIESKGMIYTEAIDCNGNKINLTNEKELLFVVPTDTIVPEVKIFEGNRTPHDSILNWTVSNTSVLDNISINEIDYCNDWFERCVKFNCEKCKFFFCRIGRIRTAIKGKRDSIIHLENVRFRQCQKQLKNERRTALKNNRSNSSNPIPQSTVINITPDIDSNRLDGCLKIKEMFEKYGVNDLEALMLAINKPLMDSLGVTTLQQLKDTLPKIKTGRIETAYLNNQVSFDDFKYYVFNSNQLEWKNLDLFANFPKNSLINLKVNLPVEPNVDCKVVFIDRKIIIPPNKESGQYVFENVPIGEKIWIVALRYESGKPYLFMQQTTVENKTYNVNFKFYSLEDLKTELLKLNQ